MSSVVFIGNSMPLEKSYSRCRKGRRCYLTTTSRGKLPSSNH